jgi:DNA-binding LacI/PurR family transcriptional regulator
MPSKDKSPELTRHATMADVAAHVGVSRQLVGLVFRGAPGVSAKTEVKIRAAAKELGYRPNLAAQSLRRDGSKYIGFVFQPSHSSTSEIIPEIYRFAAERGFQVMLSAVSGKRTEEEAIEEVLGHRCDGIILSASQSSIAKLQKLSKIVPLVSLGRRLSGVRCGVVASRGEAGVFEAVEHLIKLGHKSILYIDAKDMFDHEFRLEGYKTAMDKAKLKKSVIAVTGDFVEAGGASAAERILALPVLPTAIVASNDQMAFGLVHRLLKAGIKVPQDVSVVGYDDTVAKLPFLDLTTVRQDPKEMAKAAVFDLADRIKGDKHLTETVLTNSKLVIRSSTSKPRSK